MRYHCCEPRRLEVVKDLGADNGIEFVEVLDRAAPLEDLRQRTLLVKFLRAGTALAADNIRIAGGERIKNVAVEWVRAVADLPAAENWAADRLEEPERFLVVRTRYYGDFSQYTLKVVKSAQDDSVPANFDPRLSAARFSFKVECETDFDCGELPACPPQPLQAPRLDYLAKDYASFRRLMLDRISQLAPQWRERSPADIGVTLVELLAYVGDHLSYQQDAVATEAYIGTARRRVSIRRHARLVDYRLHEGCNARAWVRVFVSGEVPIEKGTALLTGVPGLPRRVEPGSRDWRDALERGALVFETANEKPLLLRPLHEAMPFYTWGERACSLPRGTTRATLRGHYPELKAGDVLVFAEIAGPANGNPADADKTRRVAVRLTDVRLGTDRAGGLFDTPVSADAVPVTEIEWAAQDALVTPLCVSVLLETGEAVVSEAWGNIVPADHGRTVAEQRLAEEVSASGLSYAQAAQTCPDALAEPKAVPARYRPALAEGPLTHIAPDGDPRAALPAIVLHEKGDPALPWSPRADLLESGAQVSDFVVEVEDSGVARIRFGDGGSGMRPEVGTWFSATYRVGNGAIGNVGAEAIAHIAAGHPWILGASNPLPARGGVEPESTEDARRNAPQAFRVQERAVTPDDYAAMSQRHGGVARAAASFRWTGSWHTAFVTVDRAGAADVDPAFERDLRAYLERYRMAGYDLEVDGPRFVPLDLKLHVCVKRDYFRAHVRSALLAALGSGVLPDGRRGLFHPDNFSFAQPVYLSAIYAAAQAIDGVDSVKVETFARLWEPEVGGIEEGKLEMGRLEIARLDNDRSFPERGLLRIRLGGGR